MRGAYMGWWVPVLVLSVPPLLLVLLHLLARLEDWMLKADERAAAVAALLEQVDEPDDVEVAVRRLLSGVADKPQRRVDRAAPQDVRVRRRRLRAALVRAAVVRPLRRPEQHRRAAAVAAARPVQTPAVGTRSEADRS